MASSIRSFVPTEHQGLVAYAQLLERWNSKINLVGRQDIKNLWPRHIVDSLFLLNCLPNHGVAPAVLDIGTGGGLPGMVLAIVDDQRQYVLCDRSERKVRFLNQVVAQLGLRNVQTLCGDFDKPLIDAALTSSNSSLTLPATFGAITARAVAPPVTLWPAAEPLLADEGQLLVPCGPQTKDQLPTGVDVEWVPDDQADGDRGVVKLTKGSSRGSTCT